MHLNDCVSSPLGAAVSDTEVLRSTRRSEPLTDSPAARWGLPPEMGQIHEASASLPGMNLSRQ